MRRFLAALLLCFTVAAPVAAAPITINSSNVYVTAVDNFFDDS